MVKKVINVKGFNRKIKDKFGNPKFVRVKPHRAKVNKKK